MRNSAAASQLRTTGGLRRVLVATPVSDATRRSLAGLPAVSVRPELAADPDALPAALAAERPDTVIVGANRVDAEAMAAWTAAHDGGRLVIVRRGTSLAGIDLDTAARHGIEVVSTPGVDAPYVARFIADALLTGPPSMVGLVGAGAVNGRVAAAAVARGHHVFVYSPSLAVDADPRPARQAWMAAHRIDGTAGITVAQSAHAVFAVAELLSVAVPLTAATRGSVDVDEIRAFGGSRLVSVSEPEIFTTDAVIAAHARADLTVVIDSAPTAIGALRRRLPGSRCPRRPPGTAPGTAR
ncbi:NAD(P)-dependent oxidoreductase, partial [Dactylosporangium sp. NPDC005572]|uniref:NAD(P)-dependent oxidoreductase n=1 Tax=Dactylosporangium sp. NPDC005572 TaxID=3156889 RepID=UPI0033AF2640